MSPSPTVAALYFAVGAGLACHLLFSLRRRDSRNRIARAWYTITGDRANALRPTLVLAGIALFLWPLVGLVWITDAISDRTGRGSA